MLAKILTIITLADSQNVKDRVTSVCSLIALIAGAILTAQTQTPLPKWLLTTAVVMAAIAGAIMGWASGKNPDLTPKTNSQAAAINNLPK